MPPAANVAYADAMSSGVTAIEPRPIDGTYAPLTLSGVRTPRRFAIAATLLAPTSSVSRAYTVLSERSVALATDVLPVYVLSYVWTSHGLTAHGPVSQDRGAER